jgi:hypothetical protein
MMRPERVRLAILIRPGRSAAVAAGGAGTLGHWHIRTLKYEGRSDMMRVVGTGMLLALALVMQAQQAAAQDPVGGAIVGGALGGIIGGALGRGPGSFIAGAAIGATTGAVIAAEAQRRNNGYYWWHGGCYYRYPNGAWLQVGPGYCGGY